MSQATSDRAAGARHDGRRRDRRAGADPGGPSEPLTSPAVPAAGRAGGDRRVLDPLAAVLTLGDRASRVGAFLGVTLALTTHSAASARAIVSGSLRDMRQAVEEMRAGIHDYLWAVYEVDVTPPKVEEPKPPEPQPEPEPEPEPEPPPVPKAPPPQANTPPPKEDDPYDPPPAAAEAAKVLTRDADPEEVLDMTDRGIASGEGQGVGYGQVAGAGTAKAPTFNPNAKVGGVVGGKGTGDPVPPPPPPGPDRSAPAGLIGSSNWNCPFPPEADVDQIDHAKVVLMITVRPDGSPLSVKVVSDPGHGFGRAARMCALSRRYNPQKDRTGSPVVGTTPPVTVTFTR
ncbi:energy transducer TonB [Sorangium sp. So ce513]|uniref:energy transducer TonB n=1 Tax=Sorangium sp. So ce513 TaxID=3133315 RepID=UPI003F6175E1